nr:Down syndrome cell adhesion molecule-like protein Dscam2 [Lepeophtheirus salmonis]
MYIFCSFLCCRFEWLFNSHRLLEGEHSNGISITTVDAFSSSLVIPKLSTGHSGNFTCVASNSAASDTFSSSLTVNVPLSWRVSPSDENIMSGESFRLDCLVNGVPSPTITWHKENHSTPGSFYNISQNDSKFRIYPNGSLFLESSSGADDGLYLCKAENGISEQGLSKLARLVVNVPAQFHVPKANQTAPLGSRVLISCPVLGNNPIHVVWTRNHQSFTSSSLEHIKIKEEILPKGMTSKLLIHNLHRDDSALFQCFASNQFGKAVRSIRLVVQEPPEVPNNPHIVSFSSRNANISWSKPYDGRSQITAYIIEYKMEKESWREASKHIVSGTSNWAELQSLAPSHAYEIRMSAENGVGMSGKTPILKLRAKEEIPEGPPTGIRAIANGSQSIIVTWRAPHPELRHGVILGYYLGYKVRNSSEPFRYQTLEMKHRHERRRKESLELILYHLKKYTEYSIVVQAYNGVGAGPRNPEIHIRTDEDVPSSPPSNVACTPLSSTSLLILWSPPQPSDMNGILKDYRVFYRPLREWEDNPLVRDLRTSGLKITLYDLDKYQNYTIQVVASTRIGEGLRSRSIYCKTKEDIPGSPQNIKALSLDQHSILISWLPPLTPNGRIIHHSVFMKTMEEGRQFTQNFEVYPPSTTYTIRGLNQNQPYSFWVTCSTIEGQGLESEIVTETPSLPIPASIASFSQSMFGAINEEIFFPCISIGKPKPSISWTFNGEDLRPSSRILVDQTRDNSLWITALELSDSGNYSCMVKNHFGSDSILIYLTVKKSRNNGVPPAPPTLSVVQTTPSSITLGWTPSADGGSPLLGYRIHHHREFGDWDRTDINPLNNSFTLKNLRCGTHYQFYIQGVNDFGVGERTETVSARTRGTSPIAPFNEDFISVNSTSIVLKLDAWRMGGCPISSFVVEYRKSEKLLQDSSTSWILVNNNVKMTEDRTFAVLDLSPQTAYSLRITAHNSAGSTIEEYSFITLTFTGATIAPKLMIHSGYGGIGFLLSPGFLFSFFSVILLAVIIGVIVRLKWPLFQRSRGSDPNNIMPQHLCSNNESDKQIILPQSISEETRNIQNEYLLDGFCPPSKSYGTLGRKKTYGKPIILQHHHHHVHHPGNFYSEDSNIDPVEDSELEATQQQYYRHYIPDDPGMRDTQPKEESTDETEVMGTDGNWIPLTHLIGAQRL